MRKIEYSMLADILRHELTAPGAGCAAIDRGGADFARGAHFAAERIARSFANRASVDRLAFLEGCGIVYSSRSVPGGWQTECRAGSHVSLVGPVFNASADLWRWQAKNL